MNLDLLPFQKVWLRHAFAENVDTAILSGPRGLGKTRLSAHILERCLSPENAPVRRGVQNSRLRLPAWIKLESAFDSFGAWTRST